MPLLVIQDVSLRLGEAPLLDGVNLQIERGERLCLLGRNGVGKSTLMKLIHGELSPDRGEVVLQQGARTARVDQEVPRELGGTIVDQVSAGLGQRGQLLAAYHHLSTRFAHEGGKTLAAELDRLGQRLDAQQGWQLHRHVETVLSRMQLDPDSPCEGLSAGMKRRVLLAQALVGDPDLLLLDEPTNHLDMPAICWLEESLLRHPAALVFVTHDRAFLRTLATRIIELDRGRLGSWACDYETYLARKQAVLEAEAQQQAVFDKRLAQEEAWIRQGIKARRTRNEGRSRRLQQMRDARRRRREQPGEVQMEIAEAGRTGRLVIEARDLGFGYGPGSVLCDLSTTILRGDKVGIIGPNGSGKTTLLRLLLGELKPQQGSLRHGTQLQVAYFDQLHGRLDEEKSVRDNVADGADSIRIGAKKKHVIGYLQEFLFTNQQANLAVKFLSGGERNRLLLARLFAKPSNVLVLDEPTNDLDLETLELLEECLVDYQGTLLLVSHDRDFLNHVVTSTLVLEGDGRVKEYVGGYDDYLRQRGPSEPDRPSPERSPPRPKPPRSQSPGPRRLTYQEQRELEALPQHIERLEAQQEQLYQTLADPAFYQEGGTRIAETTLQLKGLQAELAEAYRRWESLEDRDRLSGPSQVN